MYDPNEGIRQNARLLADGADAPTRSAIKAVVDDLGEVHSERKSWLTHPIVVAVILIALYLPVALYLQSTYEPHDTSIMKPPFRHIAANSYSSFHFVRGSIGDTEEHPRRSTLDLYEDGKKLGPEHSPHFDITTKGEGRYSQWFTGHEGYIIIFSSSDNSDPNTNGRTYRAMGRN